MFDKQISVFLGGGSIGGLTEDALLVFLVGALRRQGNKKHLFISESDSLNKRTCRESRWFGEELVYYPEKDTKKTVPGFMSQYNRHRSSAIINIATKESISCLSTSLASKKRNINKRTTPVVFKVKIGDVIDRDDFKTKALDLGYIRADTVFKPGDLSFRGDIVDVFPIYEKEPVRISFGFNAVESISFFNIDTQRTNRSLQTYDFWDVFGKEVELGRSLVNFITWDAIIKITKKDGLYSVLRAKPVEYLNAKTVSLQKEIKSKKAFLSFLLKQPGSFVYLFYTDKNKIKKHRNTNVCSLPGKINKSFSIKKNQSFFIPFWKNENKAQQMGIGRA